MQVGVTGRAGIAADMPEVSLNGARVAYRDEGTGDNTCVFVHAGNLPSLESPAVFNAAVVEFLEGL